MLFRAVKRMKAFLAMSLACMGGVISTFRGYAFSRNISSPSPLATGKNSSSYLQKRFLQGFQSPEDQAISSSKADNLIDFGVSMRHKPYKNIEQTEQTITNEKL
ncbi:hypothetical protein KP509_02G103300 [Ceratopteris richardii]|uniref:Uncharacterized protein n=1 Tax=Ceratopteris richardii TaxID=49495 RepID=A0A8T2VHA0_CERRI|nr:hypothetical protein KP509_02G103300 [Ceratopteris richardii]